MYIVYIYIKKKHNKQLYIHNLSSFTVISHDLSSCTTPLFSLLMLVGYLMDPAYAPHIHLSTGRFEPAFMAFSACQGNRGKPGPTKPWLMTWDSGNGNNDVYGAS